MNKEHKFAICIGRFQPLHLSHIDLMNHCYDIAEKVIIVIGSSKQARTIKNPWTFSERKEMILGALSEDKRSSTYFVEAHDYYYNDNLWATHIQQRIKEITKDEHNIILVGNYKDQSSYYLNMFPQWEKDAIVQKDFINATDIRKQFFEEALYRLSSPEWSDYLVDGSYTKHLTVNVEKFLTDFLKTNECKNLLEEWKYLKSYKQKWADAPFAPTFVTVDAVVVCAGHVLVIKRGFNPGKGLYAIPGGFLNPKEKIIDGAIRELKEETGIDIPKPALKKSVVESRVFDHPERSLRGRTITHAFCLNLNSVDNQLPKVRSGSDASSVIWMPLAEIYEKEDQFFEDHFHIINNLVQKY